MIEIQLTGRLNYANTITEGKIYTPVCQTKTGFIIIGDDGYEIDLYGHFFKIGAVHKETGETMMLPEKVKTIKVEAPVEAKKEVLKEEPKKEKVAPKKVEETVIEQKPEASIDHLIDEEDDF